MKFKSLSELAVVTAGTSPRGSQINSLGLGFPFFQGTKEFGLIYPMAERFTEHPVRLAKAGDILIGVRAPVGEVNFAYEDSAIGRGVMSIAPNSPDLKSFLFYYLKSLQGKWNSLGSTGSVFENLSALTLKSIQVPTELPMKLIGQILMNLDSKIQSNIRISKTLESIAQAIFKSWFIDFDPVRAKMAGEEPVGMDAETAALFPDSMEESELGMIPSGWEVLTIAELGNVVTGKTPSTKVTEFWGGKTYPFVTIPDMHGQLFVTSTARYLTSAGVDSQINQMVPKGSTMVTGIATPGLVSFATRACQTNQQIHSVLPKEEYSKEWLFWHLRGLIPTFISRAGVGTVFPNLNKTDFSNIASCVAPESLRDRFGEIVKPIMDYLIELNHESQVLMSIRDALLPRLISGELQIPDEMLES